MADDVLNDVVHAASGDMFDVLAMLEGLRGIFAAQRQEGTPPDRLVRQAMARIEAIQATFDPHI